PPPDGVVVAPYPRQVVGLEENLVARAEFPRVLPHAAGPDAVAAGQRLDPGLVQGPPFVGFGADNQALAVQVRQLGEVPLAARREQQVGDGLDRVVAAYRLQDGADEGALAVGPRSIQDREPLLADVAGEAVAQQTLQEGDQAGVAAEDVAEAAFPGR